MSQSGQKLNDIELSDDNISELMRIFIRSRNGKDDEVSPNFFPTYYLSAVVQFRAVFIFKNERSFALRVFFECLN